LIGHAHKRGAAGENAPGRDADLIVLDAESELRYTVAAGQIMYQQTA